VTERKQSDEEETTKNTLKLDRSTRSTTYNTIRLATLTTKRERENEHVRISLLYAPGQRQ